MKAKVEIINKEEESNIDNQISSNVNYIDYIKKFKLSNVSKVVFVYLYNKENIIEEIKRYKYVDRNEIYNLIKKNKEIELEGCYIKDFSMFDYRHDLELGRGKNIKKFHAKRCYFDGETDFSLVRFEKGKIDFSDTIFNGGKVSFFKTKFGDGDVYFPYARFGDYEINFTEATFGTGNIIFSGVEFGEGKLDFSRAKFKDGQLSFAKAKFGTGDILFENVNFGTGKVTFTKDIIDDIPDFYYDSNYGTQFGRGNISFNHSEFKKGKMLFCGSKFGKGKLFFHNIKFDNVKVDFGAKFEETELNFFDAKFGNDISFANASTIGGNINFEEVEVNGVVDFSHTHFKKEVSFYKVNILELNLKSCQFDFYTDLRVANCKYINLEDSIIRDIMDLKPNDETRVSVNKINLTNIKNLGRIVLDWKQNEVSKMINEKFKKDSKVHYLKKAQQFRMLKENFNILGQYEDEDEAYVEFKRNEAKAKEVNPIINFFLNKVGKYGTDPKSIAMWMFIIVLTFSAIYFVLPNSISYPKNLENNIIKTKQNIDEFEKMILSKDKEIEKINNVNKLILKEYKEFNKSRLKIDKELSDLKVKSKIRLKKLNKISNDLKRISNDFNYILNKSKYNFEVLEDLFLKTKKYFNDLNSKVNKMKISKFGNAIYHSIVTFLTIGYGDVQPVSKWGIIISGFEGFIGLFLMSYFTVAFVRKVLR